MWYVLQVKVGEELIIKNALIKTGLEAVVPREVQTYRKNGNWYSRENVLFAGYVFCNIDYNAETYYKVKKLSSFVNFLGGKNPIALSSMEVEWIKILNNDGNALEPIPIKINTSGNANIVKGHPMKLFNQNLVKINKRQNKASFEITICGEVKSFVFSIILEDNQTN